MSKIIDKVKVILNKEHDLPPLKVWHYIVAVVVIAVIGAIVL